MADQNRPCKVCGVSKAPEDFYPCGLKYRQRTCKQCKKKPSVGSRVLGKLEPEKVDRIYDLVQEAKLFKETKGAEGVKRSIRKIAELEDVSSATLAYWVRSGKFDTRIDSDSDEKDVEETAEDVDKDSVLGPVDEEVVEEVVEVAPPKTPEQTKPARKTKKPVVAPVEEDPVCVEVTFKGKRTDIREFCLSLGSRI